MNHLIFVRKAYMPNFRPLVPFLHAKKFVVVGGWLLGVKTWILVLSFKPKLNKMKTAPKIKTTPKVKTIPKTDNPK